MIDEQFFAQDRYRDRYFMPRDLEPGEYGPPCPPWYGLDFDGDGKDDGLGFIICTIGPLAVVVLATTLGFYFDAHPGEWSSIAANVALLFVV